MSAPAAAAGASSENARIDFKIKKFDLSTIADGATILITGKRRRGKSVLISDILYTLRKRLDMVIGMSLTEASNGSMSQFCPRANIFTQYDPERIKKMIKWQMDIIETSKAEKKKRWKQLGLVLDDCCTSPDVFKSPAIRELYNNGRHSKITCINAVQFMMDVPTSVRGQIDYIFAFREAQKDNRERLYKYFFSVFDSFEQFNHILTLATRGRRCIVRDDVCGSDDPNECIFVYEAVIRKHKFKVGRGVFWRLTDYYIRQVNIRKVDLSKYALPVGERAQNVTTFTKKRGPDIRIEVEDTSPQKTDKDKYKDIRYDDRRGNRERDRRSSRYDDDRDRGRDYDDYDDDDDDDDRYDDYDDRDRDRDRDYDRSKYYSRRSYY